MKPLFVLLVTFLLSLAVLKILGGTYNFSLSGKIAMSAMLLFTASGHFAFTKGMAMMLPAFVPYKIQIIYLTGILEIFAAVGLFIPSCIKINGWLLIVFFILLLPSNVYAAIKHVDYQKANFNGSGPGYLWFRVPLQIFFIVWIYIFVLRHRH